MSERVSSLENNDLKAHTEAMLALAAAINALVQRLPQPTGLGGGYPPAPLFTVECRCNCGHRQPGPFSPYAY